MFIRKLRINTMQFLCEKRVIFRKDKEVRRVRGGVHWYAAHVNALTDAEIAQMGCFRIKTK